MTYIPPNPNGQAAMANSAPVVIASNQTAIPTTLTGVSTAANQTIGIDKLDILLAQTDEIETSLLTVVDANNSVLDGIGGVTTATSTPGAIGSMNAKLRLITTQLDTMGNDLFVTGQGSQTALNQNVILATAGAGSFDTRITLGTTYRTIAIQIVPAAGTVTAGAITFEGSNDNVTFTSIALVDETNITAAPVSSYTLAASTSRFFVGSTNFRFIRARISTAVTGTTTGIQAHTLLSPMPFTDVRMTVTQPTASALNANVSGTINANVANATLTAGTVAAATLAIPTPIVDVASAAITTTTTTGTLTPTAGSGYQVVIPVTVVSGTTPAMSVRIEESDDSGTNWYARYTFPTITATGIYRSPILKLRGNRIRYVQTITGTTPSFTRAINRNQRQDVNFSGYPGKLISAATTNATLVLGAPCELLKLTASNTNAAVRYLKVYDKATAPTVGTDVPVATYAIPGNAAGAGTNIPFMLPDSFQFGFGFALTTGAADSDTGAVAASEIIVNHSIG